MCEQCSPPHTLVLPCSTCKAVADAAPQLVTLDTDAIAGYASGLDAAAVQAAAAKSGIAFPIKFDSQEAEVRQYRASLLRHIDQAAPGQP